MFNRRPTYSKYDSTWDTDIVLSYLKVEPIVQLKKLTLKLVMLLALATAQRSQTLHLLDMNNMIFKKNSVTFTFDELLKHEKPGRPRVPVTIQTSKCTELCVVNTLKTYIRRTAAIRKGQTKLFLSYTKPHSPVTRATLRRWILVTMASAGIDTTMFKPHSTRSATTSAALRKGVPISNILKSAQWSSEVTFNKYYNKPIQGLA